MGHYRYKMSEPKLNKDGLPIGEPVDFTTLQQTLNKHRSEAAKNGGKSKPKAARKPRTPKVRETGQPSVSVVHEAEETQET